MDESEYTDPLVAAREDAIAKVAEVMRVSHLSTEAEFNRVKADLLPEHGEDAFAGALIAVSWDDVRERLAGGDA